MKQDQVEVLIKYRLEQAQNALDDAKCLLDAKRSPQGIVNRSYYAMFYAALALLQKIGKVPAKHTGVIGLFDTEFVLKGIFPREFSRDFHKAFDFRQRSDYKVIDPVSIQKAEEMMNKSIKFVAAIKQYLSI